MGEPAKKGRGRPPKLPAGDRHTLRCVVVGGELELVRRAAEVLGISQSDFTRQAVLELARRALKK
jgi:uncharacterized protein (DUF1778 family)